jgi:hypothetical protein
MLVTAVIEGALILMYSHHRTMILSILNEGMMPYIIDLIVITGALVYFRRKIGTKITYFRCLLMTSVASTLAFLLNQIYWLVEVLIRYKSVNWEYEKHEVVQATIKYVLIFIGINAIVSIFFRKPNAKNKLEEPDPYSRTLDSEAIMSSIDSVQGHVSNNLNASSAGIGKRRQKEELERRRHKMKKR